MRLFKDALPSTKEIKAQEAKKTGVQSKAAAKPAAKTQAKPDQTYAVPVTIRLGYQKDISLNRDAFGKDKVTADEIKKAVISLCPWLGERDKVVLEKKDGLFVCATDSQMALSTGATVEITAKTEAFCGSSRLNVFSDGLAGKHKVSEIEGKFIPDLTCQIVRCGEKLIVLPGKQEATGTVNVPFELIIFNGKKITITPEDVLECRQLWDEKKSDVTAVENDEEGSGDAEEEVTTDDLPSSVSIEEITKVLRWKNKTLEGCGKIYVSGKGEDAKYTFRIVAKKTTTAYAAPKEKKFDIKDGAVIRYMPYGMAADVKISPDDFEGKQEITEEEFWKFSEDKYEEFDKKNSFVDIIESKERGTMLLVNRKSGSSKGSGFYEFTRESLQSDFMRKTEDGVRYEKTKTHLMTASADTSKHLLPREGCFDYLLPKIPAVIMYRIGRLFRRIAKEFGTEAIVRIEYNPYIKEYRIAIPRQCVSQVSVTADRADVCEDSEGWIKAVEVHSHGLFEAFFSEIDDNDETLSGIYGVIGHSGEQLIFRVCSGRYFTYIVNGLGKMLEVQYDDLCVGNDDIASDDDELYCEWLSKVTVYDRVNSCNGVDMF